MTIEDILNNDEEFRYMLLGRLQADCQCWADYSGRLWGNTPEEHASTMLAIYKSLKTKPEWFKFRELAKYYIKLTGNELRPEHL